MKNFILSSLLVLSIPTGFACSEISPESQIAEAPSTRRLLEKVGRKMSAVCEIPEYGEDEDYPIK